MGAILGARYTGNNAKPLEETVMDAYPISGGQHKVPVKHDVDLYDVSIMDLIKKLNSVLDAIPEEHRRSAMIDVVGNEYSMDIKIYYTRPDTEMEANQRANRAASEREKRIEYARKQIEHWTKIVEKSE
jgi:hypothetical protein